MAEHVIREGVCDEVVMVVSPRNPLKEVEDLAPEVDRYEMVEIACAGSQFPQQIKPSLIEFLLERPSYTINTLRHLSENYADGCQFSILVGGDIIPQLSKWRDYQEILDNYPIYVYPRRGEVINLYLDKITILDEAPYFDYSSTQIREGLMHSKHIGDAVSPKVMEYIRTKELWSPESLLLKLSAKIDASPTANLFVERGSWYFHNSQWGEALNDFNRALKIEPTHNEASELKGMIEEILAFRHTDIYNP